MIYCAKHLIVGDGITCISDGALIVGTDGKIAEVGTKAELIGKYPEEPVTDYGEATLLPGLFDMHVHFGYYYSQPDVAEFDDFMIAYYAAE